jgi:hypothetical protein
MGGYHGYTETPGTRRDERIVGKPPASNLLVIVLGRQSRQRFPCLRPITQIRKQNPLYTIKVPLEPLQNFSAFSISAGVKRSNTTALSHTGAPAAIRRACSAASFRALNNVM